MAQFTMDRMIVSLLATFTVARYTSSAVPTTLFVSGTVAIKALIVRIPANDRSMALDSLAVLACTSSV